MVTPWNDAVADPELQCNEVSFSISFHAKCRDDYLSHVALNYSWFNDAGELATAVNPGILSGEAWQQVGEPEPVPRESPEEAAPESEEAPEQERVFEGRSHESTSPTLKASCNFVRNLAVLAVRLQGYYPDPTKPLPTGEPVSPPTSAGKKEKKDPKKDKKKDQPAEVEQEVDDGYVKIDCLIPLAPLIVEKSRGSGPSISQDLLARVPCPGLKELKVELRCSDLVLSEEIRRHLNPLLITLGGVHKLPKEQHLAQQEHVYAILDAFGERRRTVALPIDAQQNAAFQAHRVYFLGTWPLHETREYLQLARLRVEVHDRDKAGMLPPIEEPPPPTPEVTKDKKKPQARPDSKGKDVPAPPVVPPGWEPEGPRHVQEMWHGVASFSIGDLLNPRLAHPLKLRSDVEPQRSNATRIGQSRNLQVSQLLKNCEESRKLLASVEKAEFQYMPRYLEGSWVRLTATLAQPLEALKAEAEAEVPPEAPTEPSEAQEPPATPRYERFARVVVVVDYRATTVLKQVLQTVQQHNAKTLHLDLGQARAIATVKLDDEQKQQDLDILTGFIVMDRRNRVIVVECLREGEALQRLLEVLPEENTKKLKVLFNPELGFGKRLYADFNLVLKQVKLRQRLELLTQRPDLCLPSKCDVDVSRGLNQIMEMKRAERIHVLKLMNSFPSATCIEDIETQYGDFVAERELHGGCVDDTKSAHSRRTGASRPRSERSQRSGRSGRSSGRSGSQSRGRSSGEEQEPDLDMEDQDQDELGSVVEEVKVRNAKIVMKPKLESSNPFYERHLQSRHLQTQDMMSTNKKGVIELSKAMKEVSTPRRVGPKKEVDRTFLESQEEVHIYSGQAKNSAELQKKMLREKMQDHAQLWTYSAERNSGCFPLLEKDVPLDRMLRQEVPQNDQRKPFKYPSPREAADYRRMANQVSDSRKEDLQTPWVENQMHPELKKKEIVTGGFDAKSLGIGGAHVLALRRPALFEAPAEMPPEEKIPQMKFQARNVMSIENTLDKHQRTVLDGSPQKLGVRFDERFPPASIRKKYGQPRDAELEVKAPPISFRSDEQYCEDKGTYESISAYMDSVRRPLKTEGPEWNHSQHLNSMQKKTNCLQKSQGKAWQDATQGKSSFARMISDPPLSARGGWSKDRTLPWDKMRQVSWKPSSELTPLVPMSAR